MSVTGDGIREVTADIEVFSKKKTKKPKQTKKRVLPVFYEVEQRSSQRLLKNIQDALYKRVGVVPSMDLTPNPTLGRHRDSLSTVSGADGLGRGLSGLCSGSAGPSGRGSLPCRPALCRDRMPEPGSQGVAVHLLGWLPLVPPPHHSVFFKPGGALGVALNTVGLECAFPCCWTECSLDNDTTLQS